MTGAEHVLAIALPFVWLGLVVGISLIEAPLKFRAPGITLALGLGIGRLVFRALNAVEIGLALVVLVLVAHGASGWPVVLAVALAVVLAVQVALLRPPLDRRAQQVIAGEAVPPSRLHVAYIALEVVKVVLLPVLGGVLGARWIS